MFLNQKQSTNQLIVISPFRSSIFAFVFFSGKRYLFFVLLFIISSRGVALVSVNGVPPFGAGAGIIALDDVNCFGPEVNIAQCLHRGWGVHDCDHTEDAGVQCIGTPGNPIATTTRRPVTPGPVPDNCKYFLAINRIGISWKILISSWLSDMSYV